jgi:hypothetical protein
MLNRVQKHKQNTLQPQGTHNLVRKTNKLTTVNNYRERDSHNVKEKLKGTISRGDDSS